MSKIGVNFLGVKFASPLVLTSGILTTKNDFVNCEKKGAGTITTKSYSFFPRKGNPIPVVAKSAVCVINSVGLRNAGIAEAKKHIQEFRKALKSPFIVSLVAERIVDYEQLALHLLPLKPPLIELNLSCPNVDDEWGRPLASQAESAYEVVKKIKKIVDDKIKVIAKLTPNVLSIKEIAMAVEAAGADAISAINTVGPGMFIDIKEKKPVIGAKQGGISGPGIKPIALRCVYDIYEAVNIPIIGIGGITSTEDAIEMLMAGATMIGIGSAIYYKGLKVFSEINEGLEKYLKENKVRSLKNLIGLAH